MMLHYYRDIPGWFTYEGVYREAVALVPKRSETDWIFVEVGSWKGRSAAFMGVEIINSRKPIKLYCVDTWNPNPEPWYKDDPDVINGTLFQTFLNNVEPVGQVVSPIQTTSVEGADYFSSVDFVFIDGTHDYENVKADIQAWLPKLSQTNHSWMAGDDLQWPGVKEAVRECLGPRVSFQGHHWKMMLQ